MRSSTAQIGSMRILLVGPVGFCDGADFWVGRRMKLPKKARERPPSPEGLGMATYACVVASC